MTVKDDLHRLVDTLTEKEASLWLDAIKTGDAMLIGMALAPVDDEPTTAGEDAGADEAWQEYLARSRAAHSASR